MKPGIEIAVVWLDEHLIELLVVASNGNFAGRASLYESHGALVGLASKLQGFPTEPSDRRDIVLGSLDSKCGGGGVHLRFLCTDRVGHPAVEVSLRADPEREGNDTASFSVRVEP